LKQCWGTVAVTTDIHSRAIFFFLYGSQWKNVGKKTVAVAIDFHSRREKMGGGNTMEVNGKMLVNKVAAAIDS